jgi:hypothetical protein
MRADGKKIIEFHYKEYEINITHPIARGEIETHRRVIDVFEYYNYTPFLSIQYFDKDIEYITLKSCRYDLQVFSTQEGSCFRLYPTPISFEYDIENNKLYFEDGTILSKDHFKTIIKGE